jgi:hypothetical protein
MRGSSGKEYDCYLELTLTDSNNLQIVLLARAFCLGVHCRLALIAPPDPAMARQGPAFSHWSQSSCLIMKNY